MMDPILDEIDKKEELTIKTGDCPMNEEDYQLFHLFIEEALKDESAKYPSPTLEETEEDKQWSSDLSRYFNDRLPPSEQIFDPDFLSN